MLNRTFMECKHDHIAKQLVRQLVKGHLKPDLNVHRHQLSKHSGVYTCPFDVRKAVVIDLFAGMPQPLQLTSLPLQPLSSLPCLNDHRGDHTLCHYPNSVQHHPLNA